MSKIEWTDKTWNPIVGCSKISAGCENCYAEKMAGRLSNMGLPQYDEVISWGPWNGEFDKKAKAPAHWNGKTAFVESALEKPLHWKKPCKIFVCSMGDLFHDSVPFEWIDKVFAVMALCPQHTFQILTKRPGRMAEYITSIPTFHLGSPRDMVLWDTWRAEYITSIPTFHLGSPRDMVLWDTWMAEYITSIPTFHLGSPRDMVLWDTWRAIYGKKLNDRPQWPLPNVWLGTTCENQAAADERFASIYRLSTSGWITFVSIEPMLEAVDLSKWLCCKACADDWGGTRKTADLAVIKHCGNPQLDWVICGGESGPKARPMNPKWARSLRDQCKAANVPFFFKQWGEWIPSDQNQATRFMPYRGPLKIWREPNDDPSNQDPGLYSFRVGKKKSGRMLDGKIYSEFPAGVK